VDGDAAVIAVPGTGRAEGPPDVVRVRLTATAVRPTLAEALADSEDAARRVRAVLAAAGVAAQDAATRGLSVHAEQVWNDGTARITGFRSEHELAVTLRDLTSAGRLLGETVVAGGDDVRLHGVDFVVEDDVPLRDRARAAAWADALRRAEQLAHLAGRRLGPVRRVVEETGGQGGPVPMGLRQAASAGEVDVQPGAVAVEVTLSVAWEIV
jgi:hypothetical protein